MNTGIITNNFHYFLVGAYPDGPLGGLSLTLLLSLAAGVLASLLGLAWGIGLTRLGGLPGRILQATCAVLRAIPALMLIFWCYFLLPIVFGVDIPGLLTVILALGLISGAYLAHAVASGIRAIGQGQWEAGRACGMRDSQVLRFIILPQALRMMRPSFVNQWVTLIKDTSLAYIVGVAEFTFVASQVNSREQVYPLEVFGFVGIVYLILCTSLQWLASRSFAPRTA